MADRSLKRFSLVVFSVLLWLPSTSHAAPPRAVLLRLVSDDTGICIVVQDLRAKLARLEQSPFAARLTETRIGQALRNAPEVQKLVALDEQLRHHLRISWAQLRDDVLGDAVVLAYVPGPPDRPEAEQGLLLIHARQPQVLAELIDRINDWQRQTGELIGLERREFRGQVYYQRRKKTDGDEFYFLRGPVFALSDKEARLRKVIDRDQETTPAEAEPSALTRRWQPLGVERSLLVGWINPRAFAPAVRQKVEQASGPAGTFLQAFARSWSALDDIALFLDVEGDITGGVAVRARTSELPPAARTLFADAARPSAVLASIPDNALFLATGRVAWLPLVEASGEFLTPDARQSMRDAVGGEALTDILRQIGPDWGVWLTPPESVEKHWLPSLTAVLRLRPAEQSTRDAVDLIARLAVLAYNAQRPDPLRLRWDTQDGIEMRVIEGDALPPGLQPAFAWKDGYLVLASTPEAVRRFQAPSRTDVSLADGAEVPLLRLALRGWAGYLRSYRKPVAAALAEAYPLSPAEADARIDRWLEGLSLFDVIEVTQRTAAGRATLTLRIQTLPRPNDAGAKKPH